MSRFRLTHQVQDFACKTAGYRHRRLWTILGWGLVGAVLVSSLIPLDVDLNEGKDKVAHLVAYASLVFWFGMLYRGMLQQLAMLVAFSALGVVIEFVQGMTGWRSFELADMAANAIGAALGWGLLQTPLGFALEWIERVWVRK
jgi:VanZ family protein